MRLLICGGRNWSERFPILDALLELWPVIVIEGGARGADRLAREAAEWCGIPVQTYPADWSHYGKAAGGIRNQRMLDEGRPDMVLACPDPESRGTWDMVRRAEAAGVPVRIVRPA